MIYSTEKEAARQEFESLLQRIKEKVLDSLASTADSSSLSGTQFEKLVFEKSLECAIGTIFEAKLKHTSDRDFPDIVAAEYFGVEVKATKKDDWISIGNSVLESSRIKSVEKIYIFFGKLGGEPEVKVRNYEDCLSGIAVTHYPRYQINMDLAEGESIFDKMSTTYQELRSQSNPVKEIRKYYKNQLKKGEELWWINDDLDDSTAPTPVIKFFGSMESTARDRVKAEIFVYIPEILSSSSTKYNKVAAYLASSYGIISSSLRDNFSAGGQVELDINSMKVTVPQMVNEMLRLKPLINEVLERETAESLANRWLKKVDRKNAQEAWLNEIDSQTADSWKVAKLSELYQQFNG